MTRRAREQPPIYLHTNCRCVLLPVSLGDATLDEGVPDDVTLHNDSPKDEFPIGGLPVSSEHLTFGSVPGSVPASIPSLVPGSLGVPLWFATCCDIRTSLPSSVDAAVPLGIEHTASFSGYAAGSVTSSQRSTVYGSKPSSFDAIQKPTRTWVTIDSLGIRQHPVGKIEFKLKLDTDLLSRTITKMAKQFAVTTEQALLNATKAFRNLGQSMASVGPIVFPLAVDLKADKGMFLASGSHIAPQTPQVVMGAPRVEYATCVHERFVSRSPVFSLKKAEEIARDLLKKYR